MTGRTHALVGGAVWAVLAPQVVAGPSVGEVVYGALLCAGGALLPDLDHARSRATRSGGVATRAVGLGVRTAAGGHRGATHSLVAVGLLWVVLTMSADRLLVAEARWIADAVSVGALSHVVADAVTLGGVPVLWPVSRRRLGLPLVRTDGLADRLLGWASAAVLVVATASAG